MDDFSNTIRKHIFLRKKLSAPPQTYAVTPSVETVDEGSSVTFAISTTNVSDGTTLYWTIEGTVNPTDFVQETESGSFTVTSDSASVTLNLKADNTTEGDETFTFSVRTGSISGPVVFTTGTITVNDTSISLSFTWVEQSTFLTLKWAYMDMSDDGNTIISTSQSAAVAQRGVYFTRNRGGLWYTPSLTSGMTFTSGMYTSDVAVASANSNIMYAANRGGTNLLVTSIYKSINGGLNWSSISPAVANWVSIACSSDGQVVLAGNAYAADVNYSNRLIYSTNGGTSWNIVTAYNFPWQAGGVAMSSDGSKMFAIVTTLISSSPIRMSSDTGASWTSATGSFKFYSIACSNDGQTIIAGRGVTSGTTYPYLSTDGGSTWSDVTGVPALQYWTDCSISGDGNTILVSPGSSQAGTAYLSVDKGVTWIEQTAPGSRAWQSSAINGNGRVSAMGGVSSYIWIGTR